MAEKPRRNSSGRKPQHAANGLSPRDRKEATNRRRAHASRNPAPRTCCHDPEVRKGLGAVTFALGVLTLIVGAVLTAVEVNDNDHKSKYPEVFVVVGPALIFLAAALIVTGFILSTPAVSSAVIDCFNCDDPNSFCRSQCPRLSHFLKPDDTIFFNKSAMEALQTQPSKSAMKRPPMPEDYQMTRQESQSSDNVFFPPSSGANEKTTIVTETESYVKPGSKGVRFSDSDAHNVRDGRAASFTSTSSALSLKHCKVHPKNGIFWVDNNDMQSSKEVSMIQATTDL